MVLRHVWYIWYVLWHWCVVWVVHGFYRCSDVMVVVVVVMVVVVMMMGDGNDDSDDDGW